MPELYDPIDGTEAERWFPEGMPALLLVTCIQACKAILKIGASLSIHRPSADRRGMALMATPILSLAENTIALQKVLGREDRSKWLPHDLDTFTRSGKELRKEASGPLRKLRNTRSGHHDPTKLGPESAPQPTPEILLPPLAHALLVLVLSFNHDQAFQWMRTPDEAKPDEIDYFLALAARFRTVKGADGKLHPRELLSATITKDPRHEAFITVEETIALYNRLIADAGYSSRRLALTPGESADTQTGEGAETTDGGG